MKIAIPTANEKLCAHFGHCQTFTMIAVDPASKKITGAESLVPPEHAPGVYPKWLADQGANVIIAGGMGGRAQQLFEQNGIKVVVGASGDDPKAIVQSYLDGKLTTGANLCDH